MTERINEEDFQYSKELTFGPGTQNIIDGLFGLRTSKNDKGRVTLSVTAQKSLPISPEPNPIPNSEDSTFGSFHRTLTRRKPDLYIGDNYIVSLVKGNSKVAIISISSNSPIHVNEIPPYLRLVNVLLEARRQ